METEKIYYADCHCATFRARVLECSETEGGFAVTLDRTAFYPLGGGQAADTGALGGVRVLDTREEGEKIVHLCDGPLTVSKRFLETKLQEQYRLLEKQAEKLKKAPTFDKKQQKLRQNKIA